LLDIQNKNFDVELFNNKIITLC